MYVAMKFNRTNKIIQKHSPQWNRQSYGANPWSIGRRIGRRELAASLSRISNWTELAMTETMEMMVMMTEARLHFQVVWIQRPISDSTGDVSGRQQEMCVIDW